MDKWEYCLKNCFGETTIAELENFLANIGKDGWELAAIQYGLFIFKRKLLNDQHHS